MVDCYVEAGKPIVKQKVVAFKVSGVTLKRCKVS
jgi:hypothetical protein